MGNIFGYRLTNYPRPKAVPSDHLWLQHQQISIEDENYTLLSRLGSGAFGSVWEARTSHNHPAAVKLFNLHSTTAAAEMVHVVRKAFLEATILDSMRGSIRAPMMFGFAYNPQLSAAVFAMELGDESLEERVEYLHSHSARSSIHDKDYIPATDRKNIWQQFVDILFALKQRNIIHSDIKPANLVFFGPTLKVVDFGLAQRTEAGGMGIAKGGTLRSSAPECAMRGGPLTTKADIWSGGIVLYYLIYGRRANPEVGQLPPMPGVKRSPLVHDLIYRCLQYDPNRRPSHRDLARHSYTSSRALA